MNSVPYAAKKKNGKLNRTYYGNIETQSRREKDKILWESVIAFPSHNGRSSTQKSIELTDAIAAD